MAARRLYMSRDGFTSKLPVNVAGDYLIGEQLIGVSGAVAKQGTVIGDVFAGFVRETERDLPAGGLVRVVRPFHVWLPVPGVTLADLWEFVYSAENPNTATLDSTDPGATLIGQVYQVNADRGQVLVDLNAGRAAGASIAARYTRYFGWTTTGTVTAADFAAATSSTSSSGILPAQTVNNQVWFAVPQSVGWPLQFLIGDAAVIGTPYNRQAGSVTFAGTDYIVGVTVLEQAAVFGGQRAALEY